MDCDGAGHEMSLEDRFRWVSRRMANNCSGIILAFYSSQRHGFWPGLRCSVLLGGFVCGPCRDVTMLGGESAKCY